jgi:hypothetical protein
VTIADPATKRKARARPAERVAARPASRTTPADLPEPSRAAVARAIEKKPAPVQLCTRFPACGGAETCQDCRIVEAPCSIDDDDAGGEPGAPITKGDIKRHRHAIQDVLDGFASKPFLWSEKQHGLFAPRLALAGIELVTANGAKKRGHLVKPGVAAVGRVYADREIRLLYVLHVQTTPAAPATSTGAPT